MSAIAKSRDEPPGGFAGVATVSGPSWPRRPPAWLWPVSIALQVAVTALLMSYTFFFFDDFLFLQQARTQHFGLAYLREPLFEHFSPLSRILDTALVHIAPGSFVVAHGVQLALYAAAVVAFAVVARMILGNRWTSFALTAFFGQSVFLMRLLIWWTATANMLPATVLALVSIAGYLRWRSVGSRGWLIISVGSYAVSLLDYETAMLFPLYLLLITLLVLEDDLGPRAWLSVLWRERWAWLAYGVLEILALYNYYEYYYHPAAHPTLHQLAHYMSIAWFDTFLPALMGIRNPQAPLDGHLAVVIAAGMIAAAALAIVLYFRPRAWRCLVAFLAVFVVTMLPVGLNRIGQFGVAIGYELRYQQSVQFMFFVLLAFALSTQWGGRRSSRDRSSRVLIFRRPTQRVLAGLCALAIVGYGALYVTSVRGMANASWEPRDARVYVHNFLAAVSRVKRLTGREPDLIDHDVPADIMPASFAPFNRYDEFFGMIDPRLRFDQIADPAYVLNQTGELLPTHFVASASGNLRTATVSEPDGAHVIPAWSSQASAACVPAGQAGTRLRIQLSRSEMMTPQVTGLPYALRVHFRLPVRASVALLLANSGGIVLDSGFAHLWGPGLGGEFAILSVMTSLSEVDFELPQGSCVSDLSFGVFSFIGSPVK
jgi:hypothetical protein